MKANIGLSVQARMGLASRLQTLLADEYVIYTKTRNYHWNVTGPHFNDLHKFFETQYDAIDERIDQIAEFVRYYGEKVPATLGSFQKISRLKEPEATNLTANQMIANLLQDHESVIGALRTDVAAAEQFEASEAADFLTGLVEEHSKMAWMLRSMLE